MANQFKNNYQKEGELNDTCNNFEKVSAFLDKERQNDDKKPWGKLDKSVKLSKLHQYSQIYAEENNLNQMQIALLKAFLKGCLDKKRLESSKDIHYNKDKQVIENIPRLNYSNKRFTLKRLDKRETTSASLTPRKKTMKSKDT
jgi:hypothetical protein